MTKEITKLYLLNLKTNKMENQEDIAKEILELREEINYLIEEQKILDAFFKKGMDNNKYKELLLQKNEIEKTIVEIEVELQLLEVRRKKDIN